MLWLLTQVWVWAVVALLLGVLVGWVFWARPLRRRAAEIERGRPDRPRDRRLTATRPGSWRTAPCRGSTARPGSGT